MKRKFMKAVFGLIIILSFTICVQAREAGFYTNGISASSIDGANLLLNELIANRDEHQVCYKGDYQSALDNVHNSISIAINDIYGEGEHPALDAEVIGSNGQSASAIISACH